MIKCLEIVKKIIKINRIDIGNQIYVFCFVSNIASVIMVF